MPVRCIKKKNSYKRRKIRKDWGILERDFLHKYDRMGEAK